MTKGKIKPKKKRMRVFLANQTFASGHGDFRLHWGKPGTTQMNRPSNSRKFKKHSVAVKAKNKLVKKFKKQGYKVDYTYAPD